MSIDFQYIRIQYSNLVYPFGRI